MALIDVKQKQIHCKIVYYGPGMGGKTSTLQYIQAQLPPEDRGELFSIATETERTPGPTHYDSRVYHGYSTPPGVQLGSRYALHSPHDTKNVPFITNDRLT